MPVIPHYKLTYFDLMGRAEPIRLIFAAAGVEYEDVRISFEQWPALKQSKSRIRGSRLQTPSLITSSATVIGAPYGQLPTLEFQGKLLAQSHAIEKFLGRMFGTSQRHDGRCNPVSSGLMGGDDWEAAKIDELTMALEDVFQGMQPWFKEQDDSKKVGIKRIARRTLCGSAICHLLTDFSTVGYWL